MKGVDIYDWIINIINDYTGSNSWSTHHSRGGVRRITSRNHWYINNRLDYQTNCTVESIYMGSTFFFKGGFMDELKISTMFTRGLIKKIIYKIVKKKLGVNIGVDIIELHATIPPVTDDDDRVKIEAAVCIDITKKDFQELIMRNI